MNKRTKEVREQTYGVLVDIDRVLEGTRKQSASSTVWNSLFSGWDDDDNLRYADAWIAFETAMNTLGANPEQYANMSWDEYFELRDNFTGRQSSQGGMNSQEGRNEVQLFSPLYDPTTNNYDAAAYSTAFIGQAPSVRMWFGDLIAPRREWDDDEFQELVNEYKREMMLDER